MRYNRTRKPFSKYSSRRSLNFSIVFITIFFTARASSLARDDMFLLLVTMLTFTYFLLKKYIITKYFTWPLIFLAIYLFIDLILYKTPNYSAYLRIITRIFLVYAAFRITRDYWFYFEKIVFALAIISLILFTVQVFALNTLVELLSPISKVINSNSSIYGDNLSRNIDGIVYTIHHRSMGSVEMMRNSGFMWEPGAYAAMLIIALVILYLREGLNKSNKMRYVIYCLTILSTFSTMGYVALLLLSYIILHNVYRKKVVVFLVFPFLLLITIYVINLPFMKDKVEIQISSYEDPFNSDVSKIDKKSLGRFGSIYGGIISLKNNPLTGLGLDDTRRITGENLDVTWTNGLMEYTLKFGLIGLLFLIINLRKSLKKISIDSKSKYIYNLFTLIVLITLFSNPIPFHPIYIALQLSFLFDYNKVLRNGEMSVLPNNL